MRCLSSFFSTNGDMKKRNNISTMQNDESDRIIGSCFETVSSLIRNSQPTVEEKAYVTDSFRLKLYGFYKCSVGGEQSSNHARPSFFDPVGRAKYDAWVECESLCGGDRVVAMKKYVELASSVTQTDVGRQCRDVYENAMMQIEQMQHVSPTQSARQDIIEEETSDKECVDAIKEDSTPTKNNPCNRVDGLSNSNSTKSLFLTPLIPRGHLDITFKHLFYALLQCLKYIIYTSLFSGGFTHCVLSYVMPSSLLKFIGTLCSSLHPHRQHEWVERNIEKQWLEMELSKKETTDVKAAPPHVVVGLSERSLFDLFLSVRSFPADSEIIIVPPVNIPGMMDVIRYHQLVMIPVDLPLRKSIANSNETTKNETTYSDAIDKSKNAVWAIDTAAVRKAISKKTVAIFVVHPFGSVLGKDSMVELRTMANENELDIWEDCAQCYAGRDYMGNSFSDASFFSFGPIKTATALGGGLAVLRSPHIHKDDKTATSHEQELARVSTMANTMRRIQRTKYKQQPNIVYLQRVVKCIALHMISQSRHFCAATRVLIERLGLDYNDFVVSSLRGFSPNTQDSNQVLHLRYRPSPALLSLLLWRLRDCKNTERHVSEQVNRCSSFLELLRDEKTIQQKISTLEGYDNLAMYGWLFPVLVEHPQQLSNSLLEMGYDAPCGATQLRPVGDECMITKAIFDRVLYLPVTSQKFTTKNQQNLIQALSSALSNEDSHLDNERAVTPNRSFTRNRELYQSIVLALLGWLYSLTGVNWRLRQIAQLISTVFCLTTLMILALCRYMGSFYIESSRAFSKHCDMVFHSPFHEESTKDKATCQGYSSQSHSLMALKYTRVPNIIHSASGDANNEQRMALLSGATGFIGSMLLRNLLLHRKALSLEGGVILLVRSKRGVSSHERVKRILSESMFDFLSATDKESLVHVIEGDVSLPNCGMESSQISSIHGMNVSHVFHCAAAVSFSQPLEEAALSNITSSLQMQLLTKSLKNRNAKFVHVSTAFVHGGETGTQDSPLPERLYSLHPYDPVEIYKSMLGTQSYASAAMKELKFPNTYTFSKCVCEHLLQKEQHVDTIIIRPSIVGPSAHEPFEGWAGERPSTIVAAACLYLKFPYIMWSFGTETVPFIPVDVVCRYIVSQSFQENYSDVSSDTGEEKKEAAASSVIKSKCLQSIKTVAWDVASPQSSSFSWISYAFAIVHLGAVCGHVNRVVAYAGLLVSAKVFPKLNLSLESFRRIHFIFKTPINCVLDLCDRLPWKPKLACNLKSLSPLLDLPLLFFPFSNQNFYFKSDVVAPDDFDGERFMFSCVVAAHRFIKKYDKRLKGNNGNLRKCANESRPSCSLIIAGDEHSNPTSDFMWACTQPRGNLFVRFGGWLLAKLFRMTTTAIEVDVASFASMARQISVSNPDSVVITPTHRSYYDFLVVSYICFVLPELGIDLPHIAAASEFSDLPLLGWIAASMNAFFIKRDEKKRDLRLKQKLTNILREEQKPSFLEVFIEGKRSRNRTFVKPKTGFLRCVAELGEKHLVLPITINYEALPDQDSLIYEASGNRREEMSLTKLLSWLYRVFCGQVNIGRVYISASGAFDMVPRDAKNVDIVSQTILSRQKERILVSGYHTRAASNALGVSEKEVFDSLVHLNCTLWPSFHTKRLYPRINEPSQDLLWSCLLHFGHVFAPYLQPTHKTWVTNLFPAGCQTHSATSNIKEVDNIVLKIAHKFDAADELVKKAVCRLRSKGFYTPTVDHITQYAHSDDLPMLLIRIAAQMTVEKYSLNKSTNCEPFQQQLTPLFSSQLITGSCKRSNGDGVESFGAWGFVDSRFVLNTLADGSNVVIMKGDRYSISGKPLPRLVGFIEKELNMKIDPNNCTLQGVEFCVPEGKLTSEDAVRILTAIDNNMNRLSTLARDRARHGTGHTQDDIYSLRSGTFRTRLPDAVVWPRSISEVQALTSLATTFNWCIIPFGGGTNVTHSTHCPSVTVDPRLMVSVDMKLMNNVLWVNEEDGLAHVEAGITGRDLIERMRTLGFTIGHEPDSYEFSTLGGWIATKASGMKQNKYGNIEDIVKEVTVVTAKGIMSHKHKAKKVSFGRSSVGIEPKSFMLGSEGCLGVITSAVIKIWPLADEISHESVLFPSFEAGLRFVKDLSKQRMLKPASVRLLDNEQFRLGQAMTGEQSSLEWLKSYISKKMGFYLCNLSEKTVACATITFEGNATEVQFQKRIICELAVAHGGVLAGSRVSKSGYDLTFAIAYLRDFAINYNILG